MDNRVNSPKYLKLYFYYQNEKKTSPLLLRVLSKVMLSMLRSIECCVSCYFFCFTSITSKIGIWIVPKDLHKSRIHGTHYEYLDVVFTVHSMVHIKSTKDVFSTIFSS